MNLITQLFKKIEDANLWEEELVLSRNQYLKEQGTIDTNLYFIISGSLRIFVLEKTEEHTIRFGYKNNIITALDSFITEKPSDLYIQALKETKLKWISKKRYFQFINASEENRAFWNAILEQLIYQQMERERDILTTSPLERYNRVLKRSPQLFQEIPSKHIASYLKMSPETLSRLKKS